MGCPKRWLCLTNTKENTFKLFIYTIYYICVCYCVPNECVIVILPCYISKHPNIWFYYSVLNQHFLYDIFLHACVNCILLCHGFVLSYLVLRYLSTLNYFASTKTTTAKKKQLPEWFHMNPFPVFSFSLQLTFFVISLSFRYVIRRSTYPSSEYDFPIHNTIFHLMMSHIPYITQTYVRYSIESYCILYWWKRKEANQISCNSPINTSHFAPLCRHRQSLICFARTAEQRVSIRTVFHIVHQLFTYLLFAFLSFSYGLCAFLACVFLRFDLLLQ